MPVAGPFTCAGSIARAASSSLRKCTCFFVQSALKKGAEPRTSFASPRRGMHYSPTSALPNPKPSARAKPLFRCMACRMQQHGSRRRPALCSQIPSALRSTLTSLELHRTSPYFKTSGFSRSATITRTLLHVRCGLGARQSQPPGCRLQLIVDGRDVGVLILRRLRRAIWVIIVEQAKLYPFVPAAHSLQSGPMHLGLIWGSVMHRSVFLPTSFPQN